MIAEKLPSVLYQPNCNSLSIERVCKQAEKLINTLEWDKLPVNLQDEVNVCLEDLQIIRSNLI